MPLDVWPPCELGSRDGARAASGSLLMVGTGCELRRWSGWHSVKVCDIASDNDEARSCSTRPRFCFDLQKMLAIISLVFPTWLPNLLSLWARGLHIWKGVWSVLGPAGNFLQWLFQTKQKFYLYIKRLQFWALNKTTWWSASFRFEVPKNKLETLPRLVESVAESLREQDGFEVFRDLPEHKTVRAGGVIFDVDGTTDFLHIQVSDQQISFRDSRRLIERHLFPLLESIENAIGECGRQYSLTAKFGTHQKPLLLHLSCPPRQSSDSFF